MGVCDMSNENINKYLTETMGECWHKEVKKAPNPEYSICNCGERYHWTEASCPNNNFFTWQEFGKLWEWATKQEWWDNFLMEISCGLTKGILSTKDHGLYMPHCIVNPTNFANAIYEFLYKEKS